MRSSIRSVSVSAALWASAAVTCVGGSVAAAAELRAWTPATSVALRNYITDIPERSEDATKGIVESPDGNYFFILMSYGELESDSNFYELQVFSVKDVRKALGSRRGRSSVVPPLRTTRIQSFSSFEQGIKEPQWDEDSSSVLFLGVSEDDTFDLYRLEISSGAVERLAQGAGDLFAYRAGGLLYERKFPQAARKIEYPVARIERQENGLLKLQFQPFERAYYGLAPGQTSRSRSFATDTGLAMGRSGIWMSPDGRRAVLHGAVGGQRKFFLIDLQQGSQQVISSVAGSKVRPRAWWSNDSSRVILADAALDASKTAHVAEYEIATGELRKIEALDAATSSVSWSAANGELLIRRDGGAKAALTVYARQESKWVGREVNEAAGAAMQPASQLTLAIRQSLNEEPRLVASDGVREVFLTETDPALGGVWLAKQEPFSWQQPNGRTTTGGLMLPGEYRKGQRLPLVIQAYFFDPTLFRPDGTYNGTSDAAQTLVAQGFAVLQMDLYGFDKVDGSKREGPGFVERLDSAVAELDRRELIDPERVGLTGFSRGGYATFYAVTHPGKVRLAAAVCADSFKGDYADYLLGSATADYKPLPLGDFWSNKKEWLELETTFNLDRAQAPVLFTQNYTDRYPSLHSLQILGAFNAAGKQADYLFFPKGRHELQRPRERVALQEAVVDWMNFWLQGKESSDAVKAKQNEQWRILKALRESASERS